MQQKSEVSEWQALIVLDGVNRLFATVQKLEPLKKARDQVQATQSYLKQKKSTFEAQNREALLQAWAGEPPRRGQLRNY